VADGGQAERFGAVTGDLHDRGAVAQRAELVRGGEGGARVGGFVADGAVVLGGVTDGFVDGQPQIGRVDDEVGRSGDNGGGLHLLGEPAGDAGEFVVPVAVGVRAGHGRPAAT